MTKRKRAKTTKPSPTAALRENASGAEETGATPTVTEGDDGAATRESGIGGATEEIVPVEPARGPKRGKAKSEGKSSKKKPATTRESELEGASSDVEETTDEEPVPPDTDAFDDEAKTMTYGTVSSMPFEGEVIEEPIHEDDAPTVDLSGEELPGRDDLAPTAVSASADVDTSQTQRAHLRGLLEALIFASDAPIPTRDLAGLASASVKDVRDVLQELKDHYATRGFHLAEVANGWVFRTSVQYAPFVRDLTKQKPVRLTRAQVEALAIIAYRQPITRPEIDDVRGVDSGPVLKVLLERDLVRILGKRDEVGRPIIYGTTNNFLEFFGLRSLKDLPTLREFTELTDESKAEYEDEIGEAPDAYAGASLSEADDDVLEGSGPSERGEDLPADPEGASIVEDEGEGARHERVEELIDTMGDDELDEAALQALGESELEAFRESELDEQALDELERGDDGPSGGSDLDEPRDEDA